MTDEPQIDQMTFEEFEAYSASLYGPSSRQQLAELQTRLGEAEKSVRAWQNDNHELHRRLEEAEEKRNKLMEVVLECRVSVLIPGEMIEYMDEVWIPAKKHKQVVNKYLAEIESLTGTSHCGVE